MAKTDESLMAEPSARGTAAAYVPFRTFLSAIDALEHGVPKQLDRTIWRSQSGVVQSQIMMALRFFGLVDDSDKPTAALHRLVDAKERRQEHIKSLLHHAYHDLIEHDLTKMTTKMLDSAMEQYNVTGDTKRKAITFFLQAARYADLPLHPLLSSQTRNSTGTRRKKARTRENGAIEEPEANGGDEPVFTPGGRVKRIELVSGGTITLSISVDMFAMTDADRTFVFGLIDQLKNYEAKAGREAQ